MQVIGSRRRSTLARHYEVPQSPAKIHQSRLELKEINIVLCIVLNLTIDEAVPRKCWLRNPLIPLPNCPPKYSWDHIVLK